MLSIGSRAFADSGLAEIVLPESLTEIADDAFDGCTGLTAGVVENSYAHRWCEENGVACTPDRPTASESDFTYSHTEGESFCVITGYTGAGTSISLPETIDGLKVAGIAESAFADCDTLTGITIHGGILAVGKSAFSGCDNLKSVTVMEGVYEVREYAFYNCPSLTTVILPESMEFLEKYTFYNCTSLRNVVLGSAIYSIPTYCFYGCASLAEISIPPAVGYIGENAFEGCTALTGIELPEGLARIEDNAFYGCTLLSSVTLPSPLVKIDYSAFSRCSSLSVITLPDSLTFLASNAFYRSGLTYAWCSVSSYASQACSDADIPFRDPACADVLLAHVQVGSGVSGLCILSHHVAATELAIPAQIGDTAVVALGFDAFGDRTDIEKVSLPEGLIHIDSCTFYGCTSLSSISLPSTLEYIGSSCFYGCTALTELTLPDGVTEIGEGALEETGLTLVHCGVETAAAGALAGSGLPIADADHPDYLFTRSDSEDGTPGLTIHQYLGNAASVTLSASYSGVTLTTIGRRAFLDCTALESIILPEALTAIGPSAFSGCTALTEINLPDSLTEIGFNAFENCTSLAEITVPAGVTTLPIYFAKGCTALTGVSLPDSITTIEQGAFQNCTSLASISLPESLTELGTYAFQKTALTSIAIPDGVTYIEEVAFSGVPASARIFVVENSYAHNYFDPIGYTCEFYTPA